MQDRVGCIEGHDSFLEAAGFIRKVVDGEDYWVYPTEKIEESDSLETLQALKDALQSAEPIQVG